MVLQYEPADQTRRLLPAERLARSTQPKEEGLRLCRRPNQKTVGCRKPTLCRSHAAGTADLPDLRAAGRRLFLLASGPDSVMVRRIYGHPVSGLGLRSLRHRFGIPLSAANQEISPADHVALAALVEQACCPAETREIRAWLRRVAGRPLLLPHGTESLRTIHRA